MNSLSIVGNTVATMTSLELVDFINSERRAEANALCTEEVAVQAAELRHDHFMAKVIKVIGEEDAPKFRGIYRDSYGREAPCYVFPKREACLMAMSYSYDMQAKVFDRMTALEAKAAPALPNYAEALRQLADKVEENQTLAIERDHAIATKAQIGSKREATAMATAATAKREAAKLKDQLGFSARHATILQVEDAAGGDFNFVDLRRWCKANEVTPETVPDKRYPNGVKAWPAGAWMAVYGVDLAELFGEVAA